MRTALLLGLALLIATEARADEREDALVLARRIVDANRSEEHRARFDVRLPDKGEAPLSGRIRIEARTGEYAVSESGTTLEVNEREARLTVARRTHVPVFAARATGRRDEGALLEASLEPRAARVALAAAALIASAREIPRGPREGLPDVATERGEEERAPAEDAWPRFALDAPSRKTTRRGPYAELARRVLEEAGKAAGLAAPLDPIAAARRLALDLEDPTAAPRAAFLLGERGAVEARPALAKLSFEEARDAAQKLAALALEKPRLELERLAARGSWDVRAWAREKLEARPETRGLWPRAVIALEAAPDAGSRPGAEALVEALAALATADDAVVRLLDDGRAAVRIAAAAALLRSVESSKARALLSNAARDDSIDPATREDAVAALVDVTAPGELVRTLGSILAATGPAGARTIVARALDRARDTTAVSLLTDVLTREVQRGKGADEDGARDLRLSLTQALASVACVTTLGPDEREASAATFEVEACSDQDPALRALAVHALGSTASEHRDERLKLALDAEKARPTCSLAVLRAFDMERSANDPKADDHLDAIADCACESPLRSTLERAVRVAREDPTAKAVLARRLRAHGASGESTLAALEPH